MSFIHTTTYRLVSNNSVVPRIWDAYQCINPQHQALELKDLLCALDPLDRRELFGQCGLILSADFSYEPKTSLPVLELKVEGSGFPNASIFTWLSGVIEGTIQVNYRAEVPELQLFLIHNKFGGFDEKYYVQGAGLFEALEGAYLSLDALFQGWSDETGIPLGNLDETEKIAFINTFTAYESEDDFLLIHPYVEE